MVLLYWLLGFILSHRWFVSGVLDPKCKGTCTCCKNEACKTSYGWNNYCKDGCIDGHRGGRCFHLCQYDNCKSCSVSIEECDVCYDGFFPGQDKNCTSECPPNCKSCTARTNCIECKEGFYNNDSSTTCKYAFCPKFCQCIMGNSDCTSCQPGYYSKASNCSSKCSKNCVSCTSKESCVRCKNGFYNGNENDNLSALLLNNCTFKCRETCISCHSYNNCTQCVNGKYGLKCMRDCSVGCEDGVCLIESGNCECSENFTGDDCTDCMDGKYGYFCNLTCSKYCYGNRCNKTTGDCVGGCISNNFIDSSCTTCNSGMFGELCNETCRENCKNRTCHRFSGTCTDRCNTNFNGSNEECMKCDPGFFQQNCTEKCPNNCVAVCNISTGVCIECKKDYYGQLCALNCSKHCSRSINTNSSQCEQSNGTCIHGCVEGFYGPTCNESCSSVCVNSVCMQDTGECKYGCVGEKFRLRCLHIPGQRSESFNLIPPVVGGFGVLIVIVVAVVLFKRCRKSVKTSVESSISYRRASESQDETTDAAEEGHVYSNICGNDRRSNRISVGLEIVDIDNVVTDQRNFADHGDLADYYNSAPASLTVKVVNLFSYVTTSESNLFVKDFKRLPQPGDLAKVCKIAKRPENAALNRYNGIYPFDHSRVTIPGDPRFFINACYVNGYRRQKAYIASVGPTIKTTDGFKNFWQMVWHEKSDLIVMLTNLHDESGMKCEKYWPEADTEEQYGQVIVKCRSVEEFSEYSVRTFIVSKGKEQRNLTQLHYTAWPDKRVPSEVTSLVEFRQRVKIVPLALDGPVVVHCSAGVGRSGTFIALDILVEQGKTEGLVDVFACVSKLREQRVNMVQTAEQYVFLHKAVVHSLIFDCETVAAELIQTMAFQTDEMFTKRFQRLHQEVDTEKKSNVVSREKNRRGHQDKSRQNTDIPGDRERVRLYLHRKSGDHDFINAVFINSFKVSNFFIAAQSPLPSTTEDFLCMIYQQNVSCVIALEASVPSSNKDDVGEYLPADNETYRCGNYTVTSSKFESKPQYVLKKLLIQNAEMGEAKVVYHFQYTNWRGCQKVAESPTDFVHFIKEVEKFISQTDSANIIVHCLNGYERCGLFCVVYVLLEKLEAERHVSVENIVRRVRAQRRLSISSVEQLKFCYQCVSAYLESYSTYSNYAA